MSWAARRQAVYGGGVALFLIAVVGIPFAVWFYEPPTCFDGKRNQGETSADRGGPCALLDEAALTPYAILWARSFQVRDGSYNSVAYVENPNPQAGVQSARYRFGLYDERNVLVAEREGETFIMPGAVTPIFEGGIDTGNRVVARTYVEFTNFLVWKRMENSAKPISVENKRIIDTTTVPRLSATVRNTSVADIRNPAFVAVVFDTAGNAIAASETLLARIAPAEEQTLVFTWPDPFRYTVGRTDVLPLLEPVPVGQN